jgi:hypothetical protein
VCPPRPGAIRGAIFGDSFTVTGLFTVYLRLALPSSMGTNDLIFQELRIFRDLLRNLHDAVFQVRGV